MAAQIFISYAHADNKPYADGAKGWVSNFVEQLLNAIGMKEGGSGIECWMDHRLEPHRAVDDELRKRILDSKCIIAFMSPRYLESEWCGKEMDTFVKLVGGGKANDRVFLVELQPTERKKWHPGIHQISVAKFWSSSLDKPTPKQLGWPVPKLTADEQYWEELNSLADSLANQINSLSATPKEPPKQEPTAEKALSFNVASSKVVWMGDPNDDVLEQWEALATLLQNHHHQVLPKFTGAYPNHDETLYRQSLSGDLAKADLLIQLLGNLAGKKPSWANTRFVQLQAEAAKSEAERRKLALLSWRDPDIDLDKIHDAEFKELLTAATALNFDEFCQQIIAQLLPKPAPSSPLDTLSVVIKADKPDRDLGRKIQDILVDDLAVEATLAAEQMPMQNIDEYYKHMQQQLEESQGVLIVYGNAPPSWVQSQKSDATKILSSRKGIWGALLDGPPEEKPDHGIKSRNLMVLDCRLGLSHDPLKRFIDTLRKGG